MISAKPTLPAALFKPTWSGSAAFIAYASVMYWGAVGISFALAATRPLSWSLFPLWLALAVVAGQGLHLLGWVGHEGFHFNLARRREVSALLGIFFSSPILFFSTVGENSIHWRHHRLTNRDGDPQIPLYGPLRSVLARLLFARLATERLYLKNVVLLALGKLDSSQEAKPGMKLYARVNVLASALFVALYAWLASVDLRATLLSIGGAHLAGFLLTSLRPYAEHAGTSADPLRCARTRVNGIASIAYFFNNYHLEHHLYPRVPCYKLPAVHALLRAQGFYEGDRASLLARSGRQVAHAVGLAYPTGGA